MSVFSKKDRRYSETYSLYYPVVFNAAFSKVGSSEDAEDIVQNVFIRYYEKMDDIRDSRSWLLGTMRYEVLNYYRKKNNADTDIENIFDDPSLAFTNGFRDTRIIIEEAINSLKEEENRVLFDLVAIQRYTFREAAESLGYSVRQVRYRYESIVGIILDYLRAKGIAAIEDLL